MLNSSLIVIVNIIIKVKEKTSLTVVQQYIKYLISQKLDDSSSSVEHVIKCLRKLPWNNTEENVPFYIIRAVLKVSRTKYVSLPNIADCLVF